jgi:glycosyltransferase involved in cell wall biosynthesis
LYTAVRAAGLRYFAIPEHRAFDISVFSKMLPCIRQIRPDLVETHDCKSHFLFLILRMLYRDLRELRWVAFHHGYTRTSWKVSTYQQLDRFTLPSADRVVTLCKPFAAMLARRGVDPGKLTVISNAIEARERPPVAAVAEAREALGISSGESVILTVGRLSREKGQDDLITAFQQTLAVSRGRRPRLVIAGDGPERARLEGLAARLGDRVVFAGHVADPWPLYHAADVFVLPSHSEGSPLVVLEAMSAHAAIVATTVGGVPETLADGQSALLVPPRNPAALSAALCRLLSDQALRDRLGRAALESVVTKFSAAGYAEKLLALYEAVLEVPADARAS